VLLVLFNVVVLRTSRPDSKVTHTPDGRGEAIAAISPTLTAVKVVTTNAEENDDKNSEILKNEVVELKRVRDEKRSEENRDEGGK
jgi:hypothetical protein